MCQSTKKSWTQKCSIWENAILAAQRAISTNDVPMRLLEQKPGDLATERRLKFYKGLLGLLHGLVTGD